MNYCGLKKADIANGPGVRVSLFVSGCRHHCKGCFQPETWDFAYGQPFDKAAEEEVLAALTPVWIAGLTVLGCDSMEPENQAALLPFLKRVRELFPAKTIWLYTGYSWEAVSASELLSCCDVVVDGEFILEEKDITLAFRGSRNQRIIDVARSRKEGRVIQCSRNR